LIQEIEKSQSANGTKKENVKATPTKAVSAVKEGAKPTTTKDAAVKKENSKTTPKKRKVDMILSEDEFIDPKSAPQIDKSTRSTPKKSKLPELKSTAEKDVAPPPPTKTPTKTTATTKAAPKSAAKSTKKAHSKDEEDLARKTILESIETVDLPDTAPTGDTKYFLSITLLI
jgi:DNA-binding protein HU-beta